MKTLSTLIFILFLYFGGCSSLHAQECNNVAEIKLESYPIKTKDDTGGTNKEETPIKRSIQIQSIFAYLYNEVVSIDFVETFSAANVTIINETTSETVYSETSSNPASLNIDLSGESNGCYTIEIETDDTYLQGSFSL